MAERDDFRVEKMLIIGRVVAIVVSLAAVLIPMLFINGGSWE